MNERYTNSSTDGTPLAKPLNTRLYSGYKGLTPAQLQKIKKPNGEQLLDLLPPGPDIEERAKKVGARLCLLELKQHEARKQVAELRQRYERDCFLYGISSVRVWEEALLNQILGTCQGGPSPKSSGASGSSEPPVSGHSSP
jgi:hypothetical protein